MPSFEGLLAVLILAAVVVSSIALVSVLRRTGSNPASEALERGDFEAALAAARTGRGASRDELFAAAVAARHLLRFDEARRLLGRILAADPTDGEAWLESGLAAGYSGGAGDLDKAAQDLGRAAAIRSDLAESITLHRAWIELRKGDLREARHLFDEVETSLENKLRTDLGGGEPLFAEWFLQASQLWAALGDSERAAWAWEEGRKSAGGSRLPEILRPVQDS
jgi:tetratricopeptide (TPR) repeat protein